MTTSVTTLVATRDRPELLRRALRSITTQQGDFAHEILVIFDQSPPDDSLINEFASANLRLLSNSRSAGLAGARNTGILDASGEWIAFCDDDDWWDPGRLATQLAAVRARPTTDFVVCGIQIERGTDTIGRVRDDPEFTMQDFLRDRVMEAHPSTFLVRAAAIRDSIGLVDEELPGSYAEDYDWLLRASRQRPVINVAEPLVHVQWHEKSFFGNRWAMIDDALEHLVAKTPEFASDQKGLARILGQRAFANAALGQRREAYELMKQTANASWREPRLATTAIVISRIVSADRLVRGMNALGRGF